MALWYCEHCDRHFDTNDQDHADYERNMCEDCVDDISNLGEDSHPKNLSSESCSLSSSSGLQLDTCATRSTRVLAVLAQRTDFINPYSWSTRGKI